MRCKYVSEHLAAIRSAGVVQVVVMFFSEVV